ncbi:MAG: methyltransferase [Mogibacterium sp.]|nr:methyltransferase [Mogibacterium sp.]
MADNRETRVRIDDTGFGGIRVLQRPGFGYGVDSVLLAAFASGETGAKPMSRSAKAADLGTGCGIIAFIAAHKNPEITVTGFEKRRDAFKRACEAAEMNGLTGRVDFVCCDVNDIAGKHDYDAVLSNPPYFRKATDPAPSYTDRFIARHETTADIGAFARTASSMLKRGGSFYLVHRPDRIADIITEMRSAGIEPKELQMVVPAAGGAANIVLIHGIKDAGPELRVLPEIAVHTEDGGYTEQILRIYERV